MSFCKKCSAKNQEENVFCSTCGSALEIQEGSDLKQFFRITKNRLIAYLAIAFITGSLAGYLLFTGNKKKENANFQNGSVQNRAETENSSSDEKDEKPVPAKKFNGSVFVGRWRNSKIKNEYLEIKKINEKTFDVKLITQESLFNADNSPCSTFKLVNEELECMNMFRIIYQGNNTLYFDGNLYKK